MTNPAKEPDQLATLQELARFGRMAAATAKRRLDAAGIHPAFAVHFGRSKMPLYTADAVRLAVSVLAPHVAPLAILNPNAAK